MTQVKRLGSSGLSFGGRILRLMALVCIATVCQPRNGGDVSIVQCVYVKPGNPFAVDQVNVTLWAANMASQ